MVGSWTMIVVIIFCATLTANAKSPDRLSVELLSCRSQHRHSNWTTFIVIVGTDSRMDPVSITRLEWNDRGLETFQSQDRAAYAKSPDADIWRLILLRGSDTDAPGGQGYTGANFGGSHLNSFVSDEAGTSDRVTIPTDWFGTKVSIVTLKNGEVVGQTDVVDVRPPATTQPITKP